MTASRAIPAPCCGCGDPDCSHCKNDTAPSEIHATITGVVTIDTFGNCPTPPDCDEHNTTYVLEKISNCNYRINPQGSALALCTWLFKIWVIIDRVGDDLQYTVLMSHDSGTVMSTDPLVVGKIITDNPERDCSVEVEIDLEDGIGAYFTNVCGFSVAKITLVMVP